MFQVRETGLYDLGIGLKTSTTGSLSFRDGKRDGP